MIAVALVALLAGIAVPYLLASLPAQRASGAARQLVADLRLARGLAVEKGMRAFVVFDVATSSYRVVLDTDGSGDVTAADETVGRVDISALYDNVTIASSQVADPVTFAGDVATFKPRGTSNGGTVHLLPGGHPETERKVTVMSTTGRARAYRWNPSTSAWE